VNRNYYENTLNCIEYLKNVIDASPEMKAFKANLEKFEKAVKEDHEQQVMKSK
jgi:hypothetical protein